MCRREFTVESWDFLNIHPENITPMDPLDRCIGFLLLEFYDHVSDLVRYSTYQQHRFTNTFLKSSQQVFVNQTLQTLFRRSIFNG